MNHNPAMRSRTPPQMRRASRLVPHLAVGTFVFILVAFSLIWLTFVLRAVPFRQTIVIAGNPTHILSVNAAKTQVTLIDIPEDTVISAVKGYGNYSIRSLIALDGIDKHHGSLVTLSLADALGIPMSGYVAPSDESAGVGSVDMIRRLFSWGSVVRIMRQKEATSLSLSEWARYVWLLRFIPADAVKLFDVRPAIISSLSPDGSTVSSLDESKLDFVLQNTLFDTGLRSENLTVAVYNTTQIPTVGQRAGRQLSRMGIQLVFVGNADTALSFCVITGSDRAIRSKTAKFIASYFMCKTMVERGNIGKETGADLVVELGTEYASRYK